MGYDQARQALKAKSARRAAVRDGANLAARVRNLLLEKFLDKAEADEAWDGEIPDYVLDAAQQAQKAFQEEFGEKIAASRKNRPGQPTMSVEEARKEVEGGG